MDDIDLRHYAAEAFRQMDRETRHPSLEETAEFARGRLSGSSYEDAKKHFTECDQCRLRLEEFEQFLADCDRPPSQTVSEEWRELRRRILWHKASRATSRWGWIAAAVVVAVGLSWFAIRILTPSPARLLAQAYHEQRGFDLRIAGAQYAEIRRQRGADSNFSFPESLLKAQARLAEQIRANPDDPEVLRLKGEAELIAGQASAAVQTLEKARDLQPQDSHILAGLGAAYALRGDLENQFADYTNALEYLGRSLHLRPQTPEAVFNLALVLERMMLKDQAVEKWEEYLRLDSTGGWAREAREHLAQLKAEMKTREDALRQVSDDPAQFIAITAASKRVDAEAYLQEVVTTKWLPRLESDAVAREATMRLAQLLKERHGDSWLADMVDSGKRLERVPALQELAAARAANLMGEADVALARARVARQGFQRAGSKTGGFSARFEEVVGLHNSLQHDECLAAAAELSRDLEPHRYIWIRAQLQIEHGICAMRAGRLGEAAVHLRQAIQMSAAARFGATGLRAGNMRLATIRHIGVPSEVFANARDSLRTFWSGAHPPGLYHQVVDDLRDIASRPPRAYAAWFLARSAVWAASADSNALRQAMAHANLAAAAQAVREEGEALTQFQISEQLFARIPAAYRLEPQMALANVELDRGDVDDALNRLETLSSALVPSPSALTETLYYSTLGEAYRRKGLSGPAVEAFRRSIDRGTHRIASLSSENERAGVLETIESSYRGLVATTLSLPGGDGEGLRVWQSFRALDAAGPPGHAHPAEAVVSFVELPDGFVSWLSWKGQVRMHRFDASKDAVVGLVHRFRRSCSDPTSGQLRLVEDAQQLYRWMVEPFDDELAERNQRLIFELDGALAGVPVQALMSRDRGYLGDRFSVLVSSGYSTAPRGEALGANAKVLVIANPTVTGESASRFPPLLASAKEVDIIRAIFFSSMILEGRSATVDALAVALPSADVVHFGGHGYTNSSNGAILFSSEDSQTADYDLLQSTDLRRQDWSRCRLAVLSACATAAGETRGTPNPDSLVRALIKAGVPRVAASLWSVDSAATAELMKEFYSSLAKGEDPAHALRAAQQHVRRQRPAWDHPYYWSGFQLYGTT